MEGRTYRYYHGTPLYPFGYGLSYSQFDYEGLEVDPLRLTAGGEVSVAVYVTNRGPMDADEVGDQVILTLTL